MTSLCQPIPIACLRCRYSVIIGLLLISTHLEAFDSITPSKWPKSFVGGVEGAPAHLTCTVARANPHDSPNLILWYKFGANLPFYTLDFRESLDVREFVNQEIKDRMKLEYTGSVLVVDPVLHQDSGKYRCLVIFNNSPALSELITLTVYVVPSRLLVVGKDGRHLQGATLRSLLEGDPLVLHCIATGGKPTPHVTWWMGDKLMANHSVSVGEPSTLLASEEDEGESFQGLEVGRRHVRATLSIPALTKDYARSNITCRATNNNITEPLSTTVYLEVYTQPSLVRIKGENFPLVEGQSTRLECIAAGAYPSVIVSWEKTVLEEVSQLKGTTHTVGDVTTSSLTVVPQSWDHGATLTCHAHNPNLATAGVSYSTTLQVNFSPQVTLQLGYSLASQSVTEGDDVYFECVVVANPTPETVTWFKDGTKIHQDLREGILVTKKNLVLQMVRRTSVGNYNCEATNTINTTMSNDIHLLIKYLPICSDNPQTVTVIEGEDVRLTCRVDANPSDHLRFTWYFNNTLDTVEVERHRVQLRKGYSFLDYTPRSSRDYGVLACWATNAIGTQAEPCLFTVSEAVPPESVTECDLTNHTEGTLEVLCTPGDDGGLTQWFEARVFTFPSHTLFATLRNSTPRFQVNALTPGDEYIVTIVARNRKGSSPPVEIDSVKLKVAEKRMDDSSMSPISPLVGVFLGLVGGFILLLGLGVSLTVIRYHRCGYLKEDQRESQAVVLNGDGSLPTTAKATASPDVKTSTVMTSSDMESLGVIEEGRPDVVKSASGSRVVVPSVSHGSSASDYF